MTLTGPFADPSSAVHPVADVRAAAIRIPRIRATGANACAIPGHVRMPGVDDLAIPVRS